MIRLMVRHSTRSSPTWQGRSQTRDGLLKPRLAIRSTGASRVVCDSRSRRGVERGPPHIGLTALVEDAVPSFRALMIRSAICWWSARSRAFALRAPPRCRPLRPRGRRPIPLAASSDRASDGAAGPEQLADSPRRTPPFSPPESGPAPPGHFLHAPSSVPRPRAPARRTARTPCSTRSTRTGDDPASVQRIKPAAGPLSAVGGTGQRLISFASAHVSAAMPITMTASTSMAAPSTLRSRCRRWPDRSDDPAVLACVVVPGRGPSARRAAHPRLSWSDESPPRCRRPARGSASDACMAQVASRDTALGVQGRPHRRPLQRAVRRCRALPCVPAAGGCGTPD